MNAGNLDIFFKQFEDWVLWDIRFTLKMEDEHGNHLLPDRTLSKYPRRPFVASAILICCAIDLLTGLRYGRKSDIGSGRYFKKFVREYFVSQNTNSKKSYNAKNIYIGLRNALIHGYTLSNNFGLTHKDGKVHLEQYGEVILIDIFSLYFDLETVYNVYKKELLDGKYINEFNERWAVAPMVRFVPNENIKK